MNEDGVARSIERVGPASRSLSQLRPSLAGMAVFAGACMAVFAGGEARDAAGIASDTSREADRTGRKNGVAARKNGDAGRKGDDR